MLLHGLSADSRFVRAVSRAERQWRKHPDAPEVSGRAAFDRMKTHFGG